MKFIQELETFLVETNKKQGGEIIDNFSAVWTAGKFSELQQQAIYRTANAMLRKRMKAFPDFESYLTTLTSFANSTVRPQSSSLFDDWQAGLDKLLLLPSKNFARYVDISNDLFLTNSLYISPAVRWYSTNNDYKFEYDSLPKVIFGNTNLVCVSKGDSATIFNTHGSYYPNRELFYGSGGKVNWERAGWKQSEVNATLSNYAVDVSKSEYTADSVSFVNTQYFDKPLIGRLTDKILANASPENASYPRFVSYDVSFFIKNIVPDVDYRGGFSMVGNRYIGSGNQDEDAHLIFYRDKKTDPSHSQFLVAGSKSFVIRKDKITSDNSSIHIYYDQDSIFHQSVELKYIVKDRELALIRGEEGKSQSPYTDSYHQLDMYFDGLYWKIDDPIIDMKMISGVGESKATFESANYYRKSRFLKVQGLSEVHPLYIIKQYAEKNSTKVIYSEDLAKSMRMPVGEVRKMLINLSDEGFLIYDANDDKAVVKDKLYDYLLAATEKIDYDVIRFESLVKPDLKNADGRPKPNASINLLNFELTMRGLQPVILSDSQDVVLFPTAQEIHMKKNRDFDFAGRVKAGRFDFFGKQFGFDYQNFKINLDNVDSLRMKVEDDSLPPDQYGRKQLVAVRSVLQNITGDLMIDWQGNKSGLKDYPQYPIFNSKKDSYVFYDKPEIQEGAYKKEDFFFHLDPFTIDSLDNFSKAGLRFDGEMITAGIFPDFRDVLKLRPDLSLGLVRETGSAGWPAYGGKGTFTSTVDLSNNGLIGNGTIDYLASTTTSDHFIFLPDSTNADAKEFSNRKDIVAGVEFPDVKAKDIYMHWLPKQDVMFVNKKENNMEMYEKQANLAGNLQLQPKGMTGSGIMNFATAELEAKLFKYKKEEFYSDTADFRLNSDQTNALAFATVNMKSHIDFAKRMGDFKSNGGGSYVKFPLNQYICFIDQFVWNMDQKEIEFSSNQNVADAVSGINLQGSEFISVEPTQDSLRFVAPHAKYSLQDFLIKADKVQYIHTADASVIPDSGKVVVERYAKMRTLENARIIANNTTKYHSIYNASVNILGRKKYEGSGDYDYVDENNVKQHIHFNKIIVDTTYQTVADAELTDTSGFPLSPMFAFKGDVHLEAAKQHLTFKGFSMPNLHCDSVPKTWLRFTAEIDPANVMIPVENPTTDNGDKLATGVLQTSDFKNVYGAFLSPKNRNSDSSMIEARGVLSYNKSANQFIITTKERMDKPTSAGNYVSLDDSKCLIFAEGKFNFNTDFGQLQLRSAGNAEHNWNNDSTTFNLLMFIDFFFNEDAINNMAEYINQSISSQPTKDNGRSAYERGLAELIGKDKADKILGEISLYGAVKKLPDDLRHTFFLSDVKMRWDPRSLSFKSVGDIGIGSIDKTSINRYVKGNIEVIHKRAGDVISIYLEPEKQTWFYFSYTRGLMQAISSQSSFNDYITKMKPEKRINKEKDKQDFEYILSTDRAMKNFLKKFNTIVVEEEKSE